MKSNKLVDFYLFLIMNFIFIKNFCIISLTLISYDNIISRLCIYNGKISISEKREKRIDLFKIAKSTERFSPKMWLHAKYESTFC
jgi:hypothetical protein